MRVVLNLNHIPFCSISVVITLAPLNFLRVLGDAEVLLAGQVYWVRAKSEVDWVVEVS